MPEGDLCICGLPGTKRCSRCKAVWYCSAECQKAAWAAHRTSCKACATDGSKDEDRSSFRGGFFAKNETPTTPLGRASDCMSDMEVYVRENRAAKASSALSGVLDELLENALPDEFVGSALGRGCKVLMLAVSGRVQLDDEIICAEKLIRVASRLEPDASKPQPYLSSARRAFSKVYKQCGRHQDAVSMLDLAIEAAAPARDILSIRARAEAYLGLAGSEAKQSTAQAAAIDAAVADARTVYAMVAKEDEMFVADQMQLARLINIALDMKQVDKASSAEVKEAYDLTQAVIAASPKNNVHHELAQYLQGDLLPFLPP